MATAGVKGLSFTAFHRISALTVMSNIIHSTPPQSGSEVWRCSLKLVEQRELYVITIAGEAVNVAVGLNLPYLLHPQ